MHSYARSHKRNEQVEHAKLLYLERRTREKVFGRIGECFREPAWDMLLDLFIAEGHDRAISVTSACAAACVPATTALRWIVNLQELEMIEAIPDSGDARRRFVRLTPKARAMMEAYLSAIGKGANR